ncbi:hypothetical protein NMY22_g16175 [Coprinellus aureogranulatus]|nr:hypothetical protein NMY22_g16175 [Coprinellus aureogranulatus]
MSKTNGTPNTTADDPRPLVLLAKNAYVIAVLSPLSLVIYTYERALVPLYGSGPTNEHLNKFIIAGALLAAANPIALPPWLNWLLISIALAVAPNANYWVAVWTSREHNVVLGTLKTHLAVILPLVFIMSSPVMRALDQVRYDAENRIPNAARRWKCTIHKQDLADADYLLRGEWPRTRFLGDSGIPPSTI